MSRSEAEHLKEVEGWITQVKLALDADDEFPTHAELGKALAILQAERERVRQMEEALQQIEALVVMQTKRHDHSIFDPILEIVDAALDITSELGDSTRLEKGER